MDGLAYVDGAVTPLADARVPLNDRGYLLGDGVFETLRISNGRPFRAEAHMDRLRAGMATVGLDAGLEDVVRQAFHALLAAGTDAFGDELYVRLNVSTGLMEDIAGTDAGAVVTGVCKPFRPYPMSHYSKGVHVVSTPFRKHSQDPLSTIKHLSFLTSVAARRHAMARTAHDGLITNEHGRPIEASTSNLFAFRDGVLHAPGPDEGALAGVTRAAVLELAQDTGIDVVGTLTMDGLKGAEEAFLTNTTGGVVPVTRFDDGAIGDGAKGELTTRLGHAMEDLVRGA